jgi:hypothetical protein
MDNKNNWHQVNEKRARKGKLMVNNIREFHKEHGWNVDYRNVRANGVDLVAWIEQDPTDPIILLKKVPFFHRIYHIYEITNWNIKGWCSKDRLEEMIDNLNSEENKILKEHPSSLVLKQIRFNYPENLREIGLELAYKRTKENHIFMEFGKEITLEEDEKLIEGWIEGKNQKLSPKRKKNE